MNLVGILLAVAPVFAAGARPLGKSGLSAEPPAHWHAVQEDPAELRAWKSEGAMFFGDRGPQGVKPMISAHCYPDAQDTSVKYLERQKPLVASEPAPTITDTKVAGRPAKKIVRDSFWSENWSTGRHNIHARHIPTKEETIVLDRNGGFCLLRFESETDQYDKLHPLFQRLLDTLVVKE